MTMMPLAKIKSDESNLMSSPPPKPLKTSILSEFSPVSTLNKRHDPLSAHISKQAHATFDEAEDQFESININAIILNRDEINKQTNANYIVNNAANNHNKSLMRQANNNTFMGSPTRCVTVQIFLKLYILFLFVDKEFD